MDVDLRGRVALISGGSRGLGRATARAFARAGARIAFGFRANREAADESLRLLAEDGAEAVAIEADVSTAAGCAKLHAETVARVGKVDILVNNAGTHQNDVFLALKDEPFEALHQIHVMSVVRLTRLVANDMIARKWGRIINISSCAATRPTVGQSNYAAAKAAVEALTRALAIEMHKRSITVNCVAPGLLETDMAQDSDSAYVLSHQLVKRLGRPEEVAAWILMLASRWGDWVTGRVLELDGGFMLV